MHFKMKWSFFSLLEGAQSSGVSVYWSKQRQYLQNKGLAIQYYCFYTVYNVYFLLYKQGDLFYHLLTFKCISD